MLLPLVGCDEFDGDVATPIAAAGDSAAAVDAGTNEEQDAEAVAEVMPASNPVTLAWLNVDLEADSEIVLAEPAVVLRARNEGTETLALEIVAHGDRGTSRTFAVPVDVVEVGPAADLDLEVDLAPFLLDAAPYSSSVRVTATVYEAEQGARRDKAFSLPLYFHMSGSGELWAYGSSALEETFAAGDHAGLVGEDLDGHVTRVVEYEASEAPSTEDAAHDSKSVSGANDYPSAPDSHGFTTPPSAVFYDHTLCVQIEYDGPDSGFENFAGITEDYWIDPPLGVAARGIKVKIGTTTYDAADNGCVFFQHTAPSFTTTVTAYTKSTIGTNYVRLHDGPIDTEVAEPGSTYTHVTGNVQFTTVASPTFLEVGGGGYR